MTTSTDRSVSVTGPDPRVPNPRLMRDVCVRTRDTVTFDQFTSQGERCGWCTQPIRLVGTQSTIDRSTGEIIHRYSTGTEPDGVLLKACGTRRATRCPSCAATYGADARMLVRAGISGGKGIPTSVADHPMVFATLTAPSFGSVHRSPAGGSQICRPGARGRRCAHGRPLFCTQRHAADDPAVGQPLCADCYHYESAVLWNATCPELWRRTTIYVRRELARLAGVSIKQLAGMVRLSFTKVAEYQRRGTVHLHAVIRIDGVGDENATPMDPTTDGRTVHDGRTVPGVHPAPPASIDAGRLTAAIRTAVAKVAAPLPAKSAEDLPGTARWGTQIDVRTIVDGGETDGGTSGSDRHRPTVAGARAVANYVAKYATKSTDDHGALDRRLHSLSDLDARGVTGHLRRLVETAWKLGARPDLGKLRHWAHTLGFGGHWLTKSRRYSVTFAFLRAERQSWQIRRQSGPTGARSDMAVVADWAWAGTGWRTAGDAWLAIIGRQAIARSKVESREARCLLEAQGPVEVQPRGSLPTAWDAPGSMGGSSTSSLPSDLLVIGDRPPAATGWWP